MSGQSKPTGLESINIFINQQVYLNSWRDSIKAINATSDYHMILLSDLDNRIDDLTERILRVYEKLTPEELLKMVEINNNRRT
jgi:hypothetical protein